MKKTTSGFTIVELLIVIVVIGILSAISIVAYNGVQSRAQLSAASSQVDQLAKKIEVEKIDRPAYLGSIKDCPTPASGNACFVQPSDTTVVYAPISTNAYGATVTPGYELASLQPAQFLYRANVEQTGASEFLRFSDLASYVDKYGLKKYRLEFDIKSANISKNANASVYFQNGSGARYSFGVSVPVTTSYERKSISFTPTNSTMSMTESYLAFYGLYDTGNILSVKNVSFSLDS